VSCGGLRRPAVIGWTGNWYCFMSDANKVLYWGGLATSGARDYNKNLRGELWASSRTEPLARGSGSSL